MEFKKIKDFKKFRGQALRFGLVGVANTGVDFSIFSLLIAVFNVNYLWAQIVAWGGAVTFSYFLNSRWTFGQTHFRFGAYLRFVGAGVLGFLVATAVLYSLVPLLPVYGAKLISIGASFIINFLLSRYLVFENRLSLKPLYDLLTHPVYGGVWVILIFTLLWSIIPTILSYNLPLDMIENLAWGHEWQWGYHKHPPIMAWASEAFLWAFDGTQFGAFLLPQVFIGLTFFFLWRFAIRLVGPLKASIVPLTLCGVYVFSFQSIEFNANIASLPFWAGFVFFLWCALEQRKEESQTKHLVYWALAGVMAALGFYSKYEMALLLIAVTVLFLTVRSLRVYLKTWGPWVCFLMFVVLCLPHFVWLWQHDFLPFVYATQRATSHGINFLNPIVFFLIQMAIAVPAFLVVSSFPSTPIQWSFQMKLYIFGLSFGPLLVMVLLGWFMGYHLRSAWGVPLFPAVIVIILLSYGLLSRFISPKIHRVMALGFALLPLAAFVVVMVLNPIVRGTDKRVDYNGKGLAKKAIFYWAKYEKLPLKVVAGPVWEAGNVAYYAKDALGFSARPQVLISGDLFISPWIKTRGKVLWVSTRPHEDYYGEKSRCFSHLETYKIPWGNPHLKGGFSVTFAIGDLMCLNKFSI